MRLDLFLKAARLIKRRTVAKEVCDAGCVTVNGRPAKAGSEVRAGDLLELDLRDRFLRLRVLALPQNRQAGPEGVVELLAQGHNPDISPDRPT